MTLPYAIALATCVPIVAVMVTIAGGVLKHGAWVFLAALVFIAALAGTIVLDFHIHSLTTGDMSLGILGQIVAFVVAAFIWAAAVEKHT